MKKFYIKTIIFHLIFYPLITWICVMGKSDTKNAAGAIIVIFALGFVISIFMTGIIPLIKLKKEKEITKINQVTNGNIDDYIN